MKYYLSIGGAVILLDFDREIGGPGTLANFLLDKPAAPDMTIRFTWDFDSVPRPRPEDRCGENLKQIYYRAGGCNFCEANGGRGRAVALTRYDDDFSDVVCAVNEKPFICVSREMDNLVSFLPIQDILMHLEMLLLHSSSVALGKNGILFTAPSGTGKTTQAGLWSERLGARMISGDRTLLRKRDGIWRSYGFYIDGSSPVRSNEETDIACLLYLSQGDKNEIMVLPPSKMISLLLGQIAVSQWNNIFLNNAINYIVDIIQNVPVYYYVCRPDYTAVDKIYQEITKMRKCDG